MFIHVNVARIVIDVTDECKFVGRNEKTGKKIIVPRKRDALGVIGSDGNVKQLVSSAIVDDFYNVSDVISCDVVPSDYEPGKYVYNAGKFERYEGTIPKSTKQLTEENEVLNALLNETSSTLDSILTEVIPELMGE